MAYIFMGVMIIIPGLTLFLGLATQVNKIPINFGIYSNYAGAIFILSGILLVIRGFKYERVKRERMNDEATKSSNKGDGD